MKAPLEVLRSYPAHDSTLHGAFTSRRAKRPDEIFLIYGEQALTWSQFGQLYEKLAGALAARGVKRGDRVAIMGRNHPGHVLGLFALGRLGAIMVPVNPDFGARELSYALKHADVCGVIADRKLLDLVGSVTGEFQAPPWVLALDGQASEADSLQAAIDAAQPHVPDAPGTADDTCVIIYTSGTTGFPKGVMHSQRNFVLAGEANVERLHLQPEDRNMIILPFFHVNALFYSLGGVLAAGCSMIVEPRFSASTFWQVAADKGATIVNIIEAIGAILGARDRSEFRPDHKLRVAYGVRQRSVPVFRGEFGIERLFSGFGMTEIPGVTCNPYDAPDKPGSMGVMGRHPDPAQPWAQCRIVDEQGRDVAVGEVGEFLVKTPVAMQGYFRDPEQTAKAFNDGWLVTGDLVRQDADGFLFYISRKKDIIRRRGENIAAAELEMVIMEHPAVYEVAALGVPSELGEDDILVALVAREGMKLTENEIANWCRERLSAVKVPRYVALMEELPHTATHKVAKAVLRNDPAVKARAVEIV